MQTKFILSGLLLLLGLGPMAFVQADQSVTTPLATMDVNSANEFVATHDNTVVLDVRTPVEFQMSHITDAVNVDIQDEAFAKTAAALDKNATYIVHCTKNPSDGRSSRALQILQELGFKNLYGLEGGYIAWKEAELPLTETKL